jgi:hypothetical protein
MTFIKITTIEQLKILKINSAILKFPINDIPVEEFDTKRSDEGLEFYVKKNTIPNTGVMSGSIELTTNLNGNIGGTLSVPPSSIIKSYQQIIDDRNYWLYNI